MVTFASFLILVDGAKKKTTAADFQSAKQERNEERGTVSQKSVIGIICTIIHLLNHCIFI